MSTHFFSFLQTLQLVNRCRDRHKYTPCSCGLYTRHHSPLWAPQGPGLKMAGTSRGWRVAEGVSSWSLLSQGRRADCSPEWGVTQPPCIPSAAREGGLSPEHVSRGGGQHSSPTTPAPSGTGAQAAPSQWPLHVQVTTLEAENQRKSRELVRLQTRGAQEPSRQEALALQTLVAEAKAAREDSQWEVGAQHPGLPSGRNRAVRGGPGTSRGAGAAAFIPRLLTSIKRPLSRLQRGTLGAGAQVRLWAGSAAADRVSALGGTGRTLQRHGWVREGPSAPGLHHPEEGEDSGPAGGPWGQVLVGGRGLGGWE